MFNKIKSFISTFKIVYNMTKVIQGSNKKLMLVPTYNDYNDINKNDWYKICEFILPLYINRRKIKIHKIGTSINNFYGNKQYDINVSFITNYNNCYKDLSDLFDKLNNQTM